MFIHFFQYVEDLSFRWIVLGSSHKCWNPGSQGWEKQPGTECCAEHEWVPEFNHQNLENKKTRRKKEKEKKTKQNKKEK